MAAPPPTAEPLTLAHRLARIGPRLAGLRHAAGLTLADVTDRTGIGASTLSRLESGHRRPTLELLLPLTAAYHARLDDLLAPDPPADPRVHPQSVRRDGMTLHRLSRQAGGIQVYRCLIPPGRPPRQQSHDGYEWLYVLTGRIRLLLADTPVDLAVGEAAEFDTRTPHWFGTATDRAAEALVLFGPQGERIHLKARTPAHSHQPDR
jgi:transcriptional regulator with XRE-family HTH domain